MLLRCCGTPPTPCARARSFHATQTDVELFAAIGKAPDATAYPNVARFYSHIASFTAEVRAQWPAAFGAAAAPAAKAAVPAEAAAAPPKAPAKEEEEEDVDLFGDDGDAAAAAVAAKAKAAAAEKPAEAKKEKKVELNKTAVIYEVKPIEAGQDMKELEAAIRSVAMDGLLWGEEFKVIDVAFGIQKIVCQASACGCRLPRRTRARHPTPRLPPLLPVAQSSRTRRSACRTSRTRSRPSQSSCSPSTWCAGGGGCPHAPACTHSSPPLQINMNKVSGR